MEFRVLGAVRATKDGVPVRIGGPRQRLVLAVLLTHVGRTMPSDEITEWVWGETTTPRSKGTLQTYISNLRAVLGDVVVGEAGGYRLAVERHQVDSLRFEDAVGVARSLLQYNPEQAAHLLREALGWWWGRPFADVPGSWGLELEGRRLEELWLRAVEDRIEAELAVGRHLALLPELEVLTTEHPLSERLRAQHMVALYRSGRQAEALRVYAKTRALLVEEMGIDPSPELQELELRVLQQDASLRLVPLASRDGAFEQELSGCWIRGYEFRDEVGRGDCGRGAPRLSTVCGPRGGGKGDPQRVGQRGRVRASIRSGGADRTPN